MSPKYVTKSYCSHCGKYFDKQFRCPECNRQLRDKSRDRKCR